MAPARTAFEVALTAYTAGTPRAAVVANRDGGLVLTGADALSRLAAQLTSPVRFDLCLETLRQRHLNGVVEVAPGGTLTPLVKRALPGLEVVALRTREDLPAARALLHHAGEHVPVAWRALPSPENGIVDQLVSVGGSVEAGSPVAVVSGRSGASTVLAPVGGTLSEWLVSAGDPVRAGQLLAVLA
jgi:[acyl-carrier-protein] S-malonyltransferase